MQGVKFYDETMDRTTRRDAEDELIDALLADYLCGVAEHLREWAALNHKETLWSEVSEYTDNELRQEYYDVIGKRLNEYEGDE